MYNLKKSSQSTGLDFLLLNNTQTLLGHLSLEKDPCSAKAVFKSTTYLILAMCQELTRD